jgi:hypothetical protein
MGIAYTKELGTRATRDMTKGLLAGVVSSGTSLRDRVDGPSMTDTNKPLFLLCVYSRGEIKMLKLLGLRALGNRHLPRLPRHFLGSECDA